MQDWADVKDKAPGTIEPGIYLNVPYETYAAWPYPRASMLTEFRRTPAHARYAMLHPKEGTPAMELGHALHLALLEPERFDSEVAALPEDIGDRRFKENKLKYAAFQRSHQGFTIISREDMEAIRGVQKSIVEHETANALIHSPGANEMSAVFDGDPDNTRYKVRLDGYRKLNGWPVVFDIKKAEDASRHGFERAAYKYGYWEKAALYLDAIDTLWPLPEGAEYRRFVWVACEMEPPYCVALYEADHEPLQWGRDQYQKYVRTYRECVRTGVWEGYPAGLDLLGLPGWVLKTFQNEG